MLVLDRDGHEVGSWGNRASSPHGLWVNPAGEIDLADTGFHTITKHAPTGEVLLELGTKGHPGPDGQPFNMPTHAVEAPNGDIFVSDGYGRIGSTASRPRASISSPSAAATPSSFQSGSISDP